MTRSNFKIRQNKTNHAKTHKRNRRKIRISYNLSASWCASGLTYCTSRHDYALVTLKKFTEPRISGKDKQQNRSFEWHQNQGLIFCKDYQWQFYTNFLGSQRFLSFFPNIKFEGCREISNIDLERGKSTSGWSWQLYGSRKEKIFTEISMPKIAVLR